MVEPNEVYSYLVNIALNVNEFGITKKDMECILRYYLKCNLISSNDYYNIIDNVLCIVGDDLDGISDE